MTHQPPDTAPARLRRRSRSARGTRTASPYVRCQRCERPVCPECQRTAPVGLQCVDCVHGQAKTIRTARTTFGGRVGTTPRVTYAIVAVCVTVFVAADRACPTITSGTTWRSPPSSRGRAVAVPHQPPSCTRRATCCTSGSTCTCSGRSGPHLERLLGWSRYLATYLISAFGSSVVLPAPRPPSADQSTDWWSGAVGASGAVFGVLGAVIAVNRKLGLDSRRCGSA